LQIVPTAVDSDALAIRRQDSATVNLFRFFQDSSVAEGTGCAHLNTGNRSLVITANAAANADDGIFIRTTGDVGIGTTTVNRPLVVSSLRSPLLLFKPAQQLEMALLMASRYNCLELMFTFGITKMRRLFLAPTT
jgi:hypothetical protein